MTKTSAVCERHDQYVSARRGWSGGKAMVAWLRSDRGERKT
jgi:hypothetical protein